VGYMPTKYIEKINQGTTGRRIVWVMIHMGGSKSQLELLLCELAELRPVKGKGSEYRFVNPLSLVYEVLDVVRASTRSAGVFGASALSHMEGIAEDV